MKTFNVTKCMFSFVLFFVCSVALNAASPKEFMYDTKEVDGKVISKTVFLQENGLLNKQVRYEFAYNEVGKVAEKKVYRWDARNDDWKPFYLISYTYDSENINSTYAMWNAKKKDFSMNKQEISMIAEDYNEIFQ